MLLGRGITMIVMASLSLVGNVSVIAATVSSSFLHTPSHALVAVLCLFHLLSAGLSMIPIGVSCLMGGWIAGEDDRFFCDMFSITVVLLTAIPFNLLVVISIDKYIAVKYPLQYSRRVTRRTVCVMVLACVTIPVLSLVPVQRVLMTTGQAYSQFTLPYGTCALVFNNTVHCTLCYVLYGIFTALQVVPLLAILTLYSLIFVEVKNQVRTARIQQLDKKNMLDCHKATLTIFLLVMTYIVTWLPEWTLDFLAFLGIGIESVTLFNMQIAARWVFFLGSVVDPFIYALRHNKVQLELKRMLCRTPTSITKPDNKLIWRAGRPFNKLKNLFNYHSVPHSENGGNRQGPTRNSSLTTSEGSKRTSIPGEFSAAQFRSSTSHQLPEMSLLPLGDVHQDSPRNSPDMDSSGF